MIELAFSKEPGPRPWLAPQQRDPVLAFHKGRLTLGGVEVLDQTQVRELDAADRLTWVSKRGRDWFLSAAMADYFAGRSLGLLGWRTPVSRLRIATRVVCALAGMLTVYSFMGNSFRSGLQNMAADPLIWAALLLPGFAQTNARRVVCPHCGKRQVVSTSCRWCGERVPAVMPELPGGGSIYALLYIGGVALGWAVFALA